MSSGARQTASSTPRSLLDAFPLPARNSHAPSERRFQRSMYQNQVQLTIPLFTFCSVILILLAHSLKLCSASGLANGRPLQADKPNHSCLARRTTGSGKKLVPFIQSSTKSDGKSPSLALKSNQKVLGPCFRFSEALNDDTTPTFHAPIFVDRLLAMPSAPPSPTMLPAVLIDLLDTVYWWRKKSPVGS